MMIPGFGIPKVWVGKVDDWPMHVPAGRVPGSPDGTVCGLDGAELIASGWVVGDYLADDYDMSDAAIADWCPTCRATWLAMRSALRDAVTDFFQTGADGAA